MVSEGRRVRGRCRRLCHQALPHPAGSDAAARARAPSGRPCSFSGQVRPACLRCSARSVRAGRASTSAHRIRMLCAVDPDAWKRCGRQPRQAVRAGTNTRRATPARLRSLLAACGARSVRKCSRRCAATATASLVVRRHNRAPVPPRPVVPGCSSHEYRRADLRDIRDRRCAGALRPARPRLDTGCADHRPQARRFTEWSVGPDKGSSTCPASTSRTALGPGAYVTRRASGPAAVHCSRRMFIFFYRPVVGARSSWMRAGRQTVGGYMFAASTLGRSHALEGRKASLSLPVLTIPN